MTVSQTIARRVRAESASSGGMTRRRGTHPERCPAEETSLLGERRAVSPPRSDPSRPNSRSTMRYAVDQGRDSVRSQPTRNDQCTCI